MQFWQAMVWDVETNLESQNETNVICHYANPTAAYLGPGFWTGMMELFGIEGEAEVTEIGASYLTVDISWR